MLTTIKNDFHGTETRVQVADDGTISRAVKLRADRDLCGMADCTCGKSRLMPADSFETRFKVQDPRMFHYIIYQDETGVTLWQGRAATEGAAFNLYARDSGYADHADLVAQIGQDDGVKIKESS